jgi:hypothetical protein
VTLPNTGPAQLRWEFNRAPSAGIGDEDTSGTCPTPPIQFNQDDVSLGDRSVPRSVFEATTPQTLSVDIAYPLNDPDFPEAGDLDVVLRYSITIQRVRDDGSPL